ncbi:nudix-type nucleoside diphosphatase, YffH/AdpP family [Cyclobacterium xiamenense]|uniref:GDP-mannose pyrophosphatase n=2 Tax=Cyclobacterium xiamenense TaxID=1297121 RepID=A0A1H6WBM0_9BACT|nr:nudix-type nucleoside diphosphatase, YffH/AdpP family [Cyclobacterium xiamenense]
MPAREVRKLHRELLSANWYKLEKVSYEMQREDGSWESQTREAYDRGNGAALLLYNLEKKTVILTRQFRLPTYLNGNDSGYLIEICAGLLDREDPEAAIRKEAEEETGYRIEQVEKVFEAYMSPGSVTELLHFFIAPYRESMKLSEGGGLEEEQEYIEVLDVLFDRAFEWIKTGEIRDAKTLMLLQYLQLKFDLPRIK